MRTAAMGQKTWAKFFHKGLIVRMLALMLAAGIPASAAWGQAYPSRTVRIIVSYPPGGPSDLISRVIAQKLTDALGQTFLIDNRGGGNGVIGNEIVVRAPAEGYTLLHGSTSLASNNNLFFKLPYDASKDLVPITLTATTPYFLVINAALPINNVKDLIAYAKTKPGQVNFASAGNGAGTHLAGEMFAVETGTKLVHVPYKGTGPAVTDLISGHVQLMFVGLPAIIQHVKTGRLRLLAVADPKRSPLMPELPTVAEGGVPGFESSAWFGLFGPAGMPREARNRIAAAVAKIMQSREVQEQITSMGAVSAWNTPEQFEAYFKEESARYVNLFKTTHIKVD